MGGQVARRVAENRADLVPMLENIGRWIQTFMADVGIYSLLPDPARHVERASGSMLDIKIQLLRFERVYPGLLQTDVVALSAHSETDFVRTLRDATPQLRTTPRRHSLTRRGPVLLPYRRRRQPFLRRVRGV